MGREVDGEEHAAAEDVGAAVAEHAIAEHAVAEDAVAVAEPAVAEDAVVGHAAAEHAAVEHAVSEHADDGERAVAERGVAEDVPVGATERTRRRAMDRVMAESSMARPSGMLGEQRVRVRELDLHVLQVDVEQDVVQAEVHVGQLHSTSMTPMPHRLRSRAKIVDEEAGLTHREGG